MPILKCRSIDASTSHAIIYYLPPPHIFAHRHAVNFPHAHITSPFYHLLAHLAAVIIFQCCPATPNNFCRQHRRQWPLHLLLIGHHQPNNTAIIGSARVTLLTALVSHSVTRRGLMFHDDGVIQEALYRTAGFYAIAAQRRHLPDTVIASVGLFLACRARRRRRCSYRSSAILV